MNDMQMTKEVTDENAPFTYNGHTFKFSIADVRAAYADPQRYLMRFQSSVVTFQVGRVWYMAFHSILGLPAVTLDNNLDVLNNPFYDDYEAIEPAFTEFSNAYGASENLVHENADKGYSEAQALRERFRLINFMCDEITHVDFPRDLSNEALRNVMLPFATETYNLVLTYGAKHNIDIPQKPCFQKKNDVAIPSVIRSARTGEKPQAKLHEHTRIPLSLPMHALTRSMFGKWNPSEMGDAITYNDDKGNSLRIPLDESTGFGADKAIADIAKIGPAAAQTFLAMVSYWLDKAGSTKTYESYVNVRVTDLLRHMGRKAKDGGYDNDEIMAKGREVYLLDRVVVQRYNVTEYNGKKPAVRSLSMGRLFMIQSIDIQETFFDDAPKSVVSFRYHLNRALYEWVGGDNPQYKDISSKILQYHPDRQKYHILLGFCLAYYDRVNQKDEKVRRITMPGLMNLAGIDMPVENFPRFTRQMEKAINDLAADGVIPGAKMTVDTSPGVSGRMAFSGAVIEFPAMPKVPVVITLPGEKLKRSTKKIMA